MKIRPQVTGEKKHDESSGSDHRKIYAPKRDLAKNSLKIEWNFLFALALSLILHLIMVIVFVYGLPTFWHKLPEERVIAFEMLPVTEISNIKTQKVQKEKEVQAEEAKKVQESKPVEKPKEEVVKPEPKPEPKPEEPKKEPEPKPEEKPKKEEAKPEPKPEAEKVKDEKPKEVKPKEEKPKPKEEKKEPPKKKKPKESDLDSLLKTLEKASEGKEEKSKKQALSERNNAEHEAKGEYDPSKALSISEINFIQQQVERNWNVAIGAKNPSAIKIKLYIVMKMDGTVEQVKFIDQQCPAENPILCQAMVDSVIRAVWKASPLQGLPADRYDSWKELYFNFTPPA